MKLLKFTAAIINLQARRLMTVVDNSNKIRRMGV
jgi:hypothetical protein